VTAGRVAVGLVVLATVLVTGRPTATAAELPAEAYFTAPADGAVVQGSPWVRVTGRTRGGFAGAGAAIDVMLVVDISGSTRNPATRSSGVLDGLFGGGGGGLTILGAELEAARAFIATSDPSTTRVGVVTFAGTYSLLSDSVNAWVEQPLTADYAGVRAALGRIAKRGPGGATDMAAGLRLAIRELLALRDARSPARSEARKVALLLSDGFPTLPFGLASVMDPGDVDVTLAAARVAAKGNIVIHSFCLGPEALSAPMACREAARLTGGTYHPVERPADIVSLLPKIPVGRVELVAVRNATTGRLAHGVSVGADGGFSAEVELAPGANQLVVELLGPGPRVSSAIVVHYGGRDVNIEVTKPREPTLEIQIERATPSGAPAN
jgi:VWA domain-containing protein